MIHRFFPKLFAAGILAAFLASAVPPAGAAIQTDPDVLYGIMKRAYDRGMSRGWPFADELYYQSTVLDAGRAYALFRKDDPHYAEVAALTVDLATQLHYDPLLNDDAALWYVREAADYVVKHGEPPAATTAQALIAKVNADGQDADHYDPVAIARAAEADAVADAVAFRRDGDALVQVIVADTRAYNLTHDPHYRSLLLAHATAADVPIGRVPDPESTEMFELAEAAAAGSGDGLSAADVANGKAVVERRKHSPDLQLIAAVHGVGHDERMTQTAPADEYFGNLQMSPLGITNEITRIDRYLKAGWGKRMNGAGLELERAVTDWQRQYPHDATLPQFLFKVYTTELAIGSEGTLAAASRLRDLLLVQYATSVPARSLVRG